MGRIITYLPRVSACCFVRRRMWKSAFKLYAGLRNKDDLPEFYCHRLLVLKVSKLEKNYARLYMSCSQRENCDYF